MGAPGMSKTALIVAAAAEAVTGVALVVTPSLISQLLLGEPIAGTALQLARVTGIALIGLAIACSRLSPSVGMFVYSAGVGLYLAYLGLFEHAAGLLLWPAVAAHLLLAVFLSREIAGGSQARAGGRR
jgi:hypothetical protein